MSSGSFQSSWLNHILFPRQTILSAFDLFFDLPIPFTLSNLILSPI